MIKDKIDNKLAEVETLLLSTSIEANIKEYMLFQLRKLQAEIHIEMTNIENKGVYNEKDSKEAEE